MGVISNRIRENVILTNDWVPARLRRFPSGTQTQRPARTQRAKRRSGFWIFLLVFFMLITLYFLWPSGSDSPSRGYSSSYFYYSYSHTGNGRSEELKSRINQKIDHIIELIDESLD
jgi:hypothetical protein